MIVNFIRALAGAALCIAATVSAQAQTKITLGHTGTADYLGAYVALEEGFFKKHGLDVTLQSVPGGSLMAALQGGSVQVATMAPTNMLIANEAGLDVVAVAGASVFDKGDQSMGLLAGTGRGITSAKDLVGKKIGVPSIGGFLYVMTNKWIIDRGVDPKQVTFVEVNLPQSADLLKAGTIQAGVSASPFFQRAMQNGAATPLAYFAADLPAQTTGVFYAVTRSWAVANPTAAKAFRAANAEAVAFVEKNPERARTDLAKHVKLPPEVLATLPLPKLMADVTESQILFWIDTMKQMGLTKTKADPAQLIFH